MGVGVGVGVEEGAMRLHSHPVCSLCKSRPLNCAVRFAGIPGIQVGLVLIGIVVVIARFENAHSVAIVCPKGLRFCFQKMIIVTQSACFGEFRWVVFFIRKIADHFF